MLHIYRVDPEDMSVDSDTSEADARGVGQWEIVTPSKLTIKQIREFCNSQWAAPPEESGYDDYNALTWAKEATHVSQ